MSDQQGDDVSEKTPPNGGTPHEPNDPGREELPGWYERVTGVGTSMRQALTIPALALLSALIVGALIIAVTDIDALGLWGSDPGEAFRSTFGGIVDAYKALFVGSVGSPRAIAETLFAATPLILAGLAVAIGFQAGLFNIGATGQMHIGGMAALWVGFSVALPSFIHIPLTLLAAVISGALWGAIAGFLKARTGAHEVITTIMLNFVAVFLVDYLLKTTLYQQAGRNDPISRAVNETAQFPTLFSEYRLQIGFLIALLAVWFTWWLIYKTTIGFEFRAVGANPDGGRYAGMNVAWIYVAVMSVSGALAGVAGANQILGLEPYRGLSNFAGTVGFDAIALALLGRSHPVGVLFAGLLFGGLRAGGREMQAAAGVPIDLVLVLQALIIVFIAAPRLVRAIYRVKATDDDAATAVSTGWGS